MNYYHEEEWFDDETKSHENMKWSILVKIKPFLMNPGQGEENYK